MIQRTGYTKDNDCSCMLITLGTLAAIVGGVLFVDKIPVAARPLPQDRPTLELFAEWYADAYDVDARLFKRQIEAESAWNPKAVSPAGARGVAQIMPATAKGWHVDPDDPNDALHGAARYMGKRIKRYLAKGYSRRMAHRLALIDYNCGPNCHNPDNPETAGYLAKIDIQEPT